MNPRSLVARLHEGFNDRDLDAWSEVFDGRLDVESPADAGTLVAAAIPLAGLTDGEDCRAHPNKQ